MKKSKLFDAIAQIDDHFIDRCLQNERKTLIESEEKPLLQHRNTIFKKAVCVAVSLVVLLAAVLLAVIISTSKQTVEPSVGVSDAATDQELQNGQESVISPEPSGKATTGHKVGIRYLSFYREQKISIDVFMSQLLLDREKETISGYPVFEVFRATENDLASGSVLINENGEDYKKEFALEDLNFLVADSMEDDVFDGHSERVLLDFSSLNPGDTATITFSYGFFYYKDNPYNQPQPENSWCGMRRSLYFYCGEKGISVSSNCIEDAISEYEKCNEKIIETGHNPAENVFS